MFQNECPDSTALREWLQGDLDPGLADDIAEHVNSCPDCETALNELEQESDSLLALMRSEPADAETRFERDSQVEQIVDEICDTPADSGSIAESTVEEVPQLTGRQIGPYRLRELLGRGGMGEVYRAEHSHLKRAVALKVVKSDKLTDSEASQRFEREMRVAARMDHPNIVRATDAGNADGIRYLAMELVDGLSLSQIVRYFGSLSVADACEVARQTCAGLQHASGCGLVHRDLKPSNLMLTEDGVVRILDFGLARLRDEDMASADDITSTGIVMGTVDYIAPEQCNDSRNVDIRADIYSLGATLYKFLAGHAPFDDGSYETPYQKLVAVATQDPVPIDQRRADVPQLLSELIQCMLARAPEQRPSSPDVIATRLADFCGNSNLREVHRSVEARRGSAEVAAGQELAPTDTFADSPDTIAHPASGGRETSEPELSQTWTTRSQPARSGIPVRIGLGAIATIAVIAWWFSGRADQAADTRPDQQVSSDTDRPASSGVDHPAGASGQMLHADAVRTAVFSPDGTRILTGSDDNTACLWDAVSGKRLGPVMQHGGFVRAVAFSPDGGRVLTGSYDNTAQLWDAQTGHSVGVTMRHDGPVKAVAFSPSGQTVLTASDDGTARLWDAQTGSPLGHIMRHLDRMMFAVFSPDGNRILTGSYDTTARLWNPDTGEPIGDPIKHNSLVRCAAFAPDSSRFMTGCRDGIARLWNAESGQHVGKPMVHQGNVTAAAFSPDGGQLATGCDDDTIRFWDAETGQRSGAILRHSDGVRAVVFSPNGQTLASASHDRSARLWDVTDGSRVGEVMRHSHHVESVTFSPDGGRILTGCWDGSARVWNVPSHRFGAAVAESTQISRSPMSTPSDTRMALPGLVPAPKMLPDGRRWQIAHRLYQHRQADIRWRPDGTELGVTFWGSPYLRIFQVDGNGIRLDRIKYTAERGSITHFDWDHDGKQIALSGGRAQEVAILGSSELEIVESFQTRMHSHLSWHPRRNELLAVRDQRLWFHNGTTGRTALHVLTEVSSNAEPSSVTWLPNGESAAVYFAERGTIYFVNSSGAVLKRIRVLTDDEINLSRPWEPIFAISSDSTKLAIVRKVSDLREVLVYDISSEPQLLKRAPVTGLNGSISWSGDETHLFVLTFERGLRLTVLDADSLIPERSIPLPRGCERYAPSPVEKNIVAAGRPGGIRLVSILGSNEGTEFGCGPGEVASIDTLSRNGLLAASFTDGTVGIWSADGRTLSRFAVSEVALGGHISLHPSGDQLAFQDIEGKRFVLARTRDGSLIRDEPVRGDHLRWSPDGRYLAVSRWSRSGRERVDPWIGLISESGDVSRLAGLESPDVTGLNWSNDSRYLAVSTSGGTAVVFDTLSLKRVQQVALNEPVLGLVWTSETDALLVQTESKLCCLDVATGEMKWSHPVVEPIDDRQFTRMVKGLYINDSDTFATVERGLLTVREIGTGNVVDSIQLHDAPEFYFRCRLGGSSSRIYLSQEGGIIRCWDPSEKKLMWKLTRTSNSHSVTLTPAGQVVEPNPEAEANLMWIRESKDGSLEFMSREAFESWAVSERSAQLQN